MYRFVSSARLVTPIFNRSFTKVINSGVKAPKRELKGKEPAVTLVSLPILDESQTTAAEDRVRELLSKKPAGTGLLLSTTTSSIGSECLFVEGCNGNKYVMKYCEPGKEGPFDEIVEQNGQFLCVC